MLLLQLFSTETKKETSKSKKIKIKKNCYFRSLTCEIQVLGTRISIYQYKKIFTRLDKLSRKTKWMFSAVQDIINADSSSVTWRIMVSESCKDTKSLMQSITVAEKWKTVIVLGCFLDFFFSFAAEDLPAVIYHTVLFWWKTQHKLSQLLLQWSDCVIQTQLLVRKNGFSAAESGTYYISCLPVINPMQRLMPLRSLCFAEAFTLE